MQRTRLDALLKPRSVAVVGASNRANVGGRMFRNMVRSGFAGPVWPVNPNYDDVDGVRCWPDIAALPETPDCVAFAVPYKAVFAPLEAAAARGVPAAVIVADGFADTGTPAGRHRQDRLCRIAARSGMAINGPNCMGILGLAHPLAAAFTNLPDGLARGGVSVVSQSGGLINAAIELGINRGMGFNYLISAGNEAVVSGADYISWLADDPDTRVIVNIVEGVADGRAYAEALARAAAKKPVVILKLGRTAAGRAAAIAHTGSLAGPQAAFDALCRECGAAQVETIDAMIETANIFATAKVPKGDRVFVFSVSGGAAVLSGDLAQKAGLKLPPLSRATSAKLGKILGVSKRFANPMDVVGAPRLVAGDNLTRCLRVLDRDPGIDAIAFVLVVQRETSASHRVLHEQYHALAPTLKTPVVMISEMTWHPKAPPPHGGPPVAATLDDGLLALRQLIDHGAYRRRPRRSPARPGGTARNLRVALSSERPLTEPESARILEAAGLPFAPWGFAKSASGAARAAAQIGFPVAVKAVAPGLAHKTEAGAVRLGIESAAAVKRACAEIRAALAASAPEAALSGFMVQEMAAGGIEMILGATSDPQFGPLIMAGAGGTMAELIDDTALALAPIDRSGARAQLRRLKAKALLDGFRGAPPADRDALIDAMVKLSRFAAANAETIAAIDLNPVMVLPRGQGVRIVDALIVPQGAAAGGARTD
ncbi:MAG: acetate--CoA ligase family protein [Alphaproteobacteria bacterium]|nr:acetate--CoA ligase family protein [Alphaproteobacteria bacterium]